MTLFNKSEYDHKAVVAIFTGLIAFLIDFFPLSFQVGDRPVSFFLGLTLPMLIARAWGWKYGLLCALCGGTQAMWWRWMWGWGQFVGAPPFTLWIVWHGWCAERMRERNQPRCNPFLVEIPFRLCHVILIQTLLGSAFEHAPGAAGAADHPMPMVDLITIKEIVNGVVVLALSEVMLSLQPIRRLLLLGPLSAKRKAYLVVNISLLIAVAFWILDSLVSHYLIPGEARPFHANLLPNVISGEFLVRFYIFSACILCGLLSGAFFSRHLRVQEALAESERKFRDFMEKASDLMHMTDRNGRLTYVNQSMCRALGYSREELLEMNLADFAPREISAARPGPVREGTVEVCWMARDGREIIGENKVTPRLDQDSRVTGYWGVFRDMSERKRAERDLKAAKEAAEAASRAKSEFLANMSHEIRTPLNGVIGTLQLLQFAGLNPEQARFVDMALACSKRLVALLGDILDLSRVEAGKMPMARERFNLSDFLREAVDTFKAEARAKGLELSFRVDSGLPETVNGDSARLRQVLFNLIGNSIKFTDRGKVLVEVWPLPEMGADQGRMILFCVSDTGIGVSDDQTRRIFEPFSQVGSNGLSGFGGAGLGLSIVKKLVRLMGGTLSINSSPGRGTSMYFTVRLAEAPGLRVQARSEPLAAAAPQAGAARVLVVEDDPTSRLCALRLLERLGCSTHGVADGDEVLPELERNKYDMVLMDVQMKRMDGISAARIVRGSSSSRVDSNIPIVAMTAYAMAGDREAILKSGMDDYIAKPVELSELSRVVERFVRSPGED